MKCLFWKMKWNEIIDKRENQKNLLERAKEKHSIEKKIHPKLRSEKTHMSENKWNTMKNKRKDKNTL